MIVKKSNFLVFVALLFVFGCSEDVPEPVNNNTGPPPINYTTCKVDEMEFRNENDQITSIREFNYNVNRNSRLESATIVEGFDDIPITLSFQFNYTDDESVVPSRINEVFGADIVTSTIFKFDEVGNLTEYTRQMLAPPFNGLPESHLFFYEDSELANDSVNARIVMFDMDRLTSDWIDVLPALFTTGGKRINRFDEITFRGEMTRFCNITYDESGFLEEIICRASDGVLSEVWNFTYQDDLLLSAYRQLPNFRALTTYEYNDKGRPVSVISTSNGFFNWKAAYFYLCN